MPFQKGNKLGAKGRPKGSKNKATDVNKFELQQTLYNMEEFINDFKALSPDKKMDIRMKAMSFFYSRPTMEIELESKKYLEIEYITDIGHDEVTLEQKERMWLKYGNGNPDAEMPLMFDNDCA
jgi:hypothetical protein